MWATQYYSKQANNPGAVGISCTGQMENRGGCSVNNTEGLHIDCWLRMFAQSPLAPDERLRFQRYFQIVII